MRAKPVCATCRHFGNDPAWLEAELPGLRVLSSGYASVRKEDGLCALHGVFVGADGACASHEPRAPRRHPPPPVRHKRDGGPQAPVVTHTVAAAQPPGVGGIMPRWKTQATK